MKSVEFLIFNLFLFVLSFGLTYVIKNYYIKKSLFDEVNERSSHTVPTPHGGGIAIVLTWFIGLFYLYFENAIDNSLFYSLILGVFLSIIGYLDDLYELKPKIRLVAQSLVAFFGIYFLSGLNELDFGLFSIENQIITNIFAFFLIVWYINLYNFLDGINGYAGGEATFLGLAGFLLFGGSHFAILAVCVLGFLCWNYNKAKIFMGDVGSTLLGYNVAIFTLYYANIDSQNLWIWFILFGLFLYDATFTLLRRKLNGEELSKAHKKHAYQRLHQAGWSHFRITNYAMILNGLLFCLVYFFTNVSLVFFISWIILHIVMKFVDNKKAFI